MYGSMFLFKFYKTEATAYTYITISFSDYQTFTIYYIFPAWWIWHKKFEFRNKNSAILDPATCIVLQYICIYPLFESRVIFKLKGASK